MTRLRTGPNVGRKSDQAPASEEPGTTKLRTDPNLDDPDGFYEELLSLHEDRSKDESDAINARLVLILANHIGDRQVLREAFRTAGSPTGRVRASGARRESATTTSVSRAELTDGDGESGARGDD